MSDPFAQTTRLLEDGVARHLFPAAAAEVGSSGGVLWQSTVGTHTFESDSVRTSIGTIFDLASLTKPIATTSAAMALIDAGKASLDDTPSRFFPEWTGADRGRVTLRHLLNHASGLNARLSENPPATPAAFLREMCETPLAFEPGSRSLYSDLGFILLGFCLEAASGRPLAHLVRSVLDAAVDISTEARASACLTVSVSSNLLERTAPTRPLPEDGERRGRLLVGDVHDNYAAALGGFAGHAGLFGTADGVGAFARLILSAARGVATARPFTPDNILRFIARSNVPLSTRALGWDTMAPTSSCGRFMSAEAFGHVGFTGTSLWIDPRRDRYFVLLTNRVCDGGTSDEMQQVRRDFHDGLATV